MNSFMPNPLGYPVSRDWEEIDCNAAACINNREGKCLVPSLAKINVAGRCDGYTPKIVDDLIRQYKEQST
jgi:hypothetical protein